MQLSELNIGDKFSTHDPYNVIGEDDLLGNYLVISPNPDNFKITHHDEWYESLDNYCFVLNVDTSTLGILLLTQEVTLND